MLYVLITLNKKYYYLAIKVLMSFQLIFFDAASLKIYESNVYVNYRQHMSCSEVMIENINLKTESVNTKITYLYSYESFFFHTCSMSYFVPHTTSNIHDFSYYFDFFLY